MNQKNRKHINQVQLVPKSKIGQDPNLKQKSLKKNSVLNQKLMFPMMMMMIFLISLTVMVKKTMKRVKKTIKRENHVEPILLKLNKSRL